MRNSKELETAGRPVSETELLGHNNRGYVWRGKDDAFKSKNTVPALKHGDASIILWRYFAVSNCGTLQKVDGIIKE